MSQFRPTSCWCIHHYLWWTTLINYFFHPSFTVYVQRNSFSNIMSLPHHLLKLWMLMLPCLIWEKEGHITNIFQTFYIDGIFKSHFIHMQDFTIGGRVHSISAVIQDIWTKPFFQTKDRLLSFTFHAKGISPIMTYTH